MSDLHSAPHAAPSRALAAALSITIVALVTGSGSARAQTRAEPLVSQEQLLAAELGQQELIVDEGVTRVWLDVRQLERSDSVLISAPGGRSLVDAAAVETLATDLDMSGVDLLGRWMDLTTWAAPATGRYLLDSGRPYLAIAHLEGGGRLRFWVEPLEDERLLPLRQPLSLFVELADAAGRPLADGAVRATIEQTARLDGGPLKRPFAVTVPLIPAGKAGTYATTLTAGLPATGVYTFSVDGEQGLLRRHLVASLPVFQRSTYLPPIVEPSTVDEEEFLDLPEDLPPGGGPPDAPPGTVTYFTESLADRTRPVVVFVHGFNDGTTLWTGPKGFLFPALQAGYRVATVGLHPDESFVDNAAILAGALPAIAAHYDVEKVVVVAHSKGGVDTDAALLHHGMTDYAKSVITLASPHWGTPLADLADSSWVSWLADIFGLRNAGQRSMKPGSMAAFRAEVAGHPRNTFEHLDIRTISGWDWKAELLSYYMLSGAYLANHGGGSGNGGNDGVVNYRDSRRPVSTEIFGGRPHPDTKVNHRQIHSKNKYWHRVANQLQTVTYDNSPTAPEGLAASLEEAAGAISIRLTWRDRSRWETGFRLERSVDEGPFTELPHVLPAHSEEAIDSDLEDGRTYTYRLRAHIEDRWYSDYSSTAAATTADAADLRVSGPGGTIPPGGTFALGNTPFGQPLDRTLTLHNDGGRPLHIDSLTVTSHHFQVMPPSVTTIAPSGSADFGVRLVATAGGFFTGNLRIDSDDRDENPYTFAVRGTVAAPAPEIRVVLTGVGELPDGGAYAFPPTALPELPISRRFEVWNDGDADLVLANPTAVVAGSGFSQIGDPPLATRIHPGEHATFRVRFHVASAGPYQGVVRIESNDADEASISIDLSAAALGPCVPSATRLCLRQDRFLIEADTPAGAARARPHTDLSGFFWIDDPDNLEIGVKVLGPVNGRWWVFEGPATSLAYNLKVFDTQTGEQKGYTKPAGSLCGHADTDALPAALSPTETADKGRIVTIPLPGREWRAGAPPIARDPQLGKSTSCVPGPRSLCLNGGGFRVELLRGGVPQPADPLTPLTGAFSFANPANSEVFVKLLGPVSGRFWVFYGSLTNQAYTLRVTDTATGRIRAYHNPQGTYCGGADTSAF